MSVESRRTHAARFRPGRSLGLTAVAGLLWVGACSAPPPVEPPAPSPLLRPASTTAAPYTARLAELLLLAEIESETDEIDFAQLDDGSPLLEGWSLEPTLGKAWGTGEGSELEFIVIPVRDLEISFRCSPFHYAGSERQTVTVVVNGQELERLRLWRMNRSYRVRVPASVLRLGVNRLEFRYGFAAVPNEVLEDSDDGRSLAVMWEWIRFQDDSGAVAEPEASADRTVLHLPFSTRINYYLELGTDSALRIGGVEVWSDGETRASAGMRLRLEATVDGADQPVVVELTPEQIRGPFELPLPVETTGQRAHVALAAFRVDGARGGSPESDPGPWGLAVDLPEIVSNDTRLAARLEADPRSPAPSVARLADRPNVIVYLIDTLRSDHLGAYGYSLPTSPNIDAFASDATLFENVVAQASWTKPAVASVLTGLNPQIHGVNGRRDALSPDAETLAETLWDAGYETAAIYTNGNLSHMKLGQGFATYKHLREGKHEAIHVLSDRLHEEAMGWLDRRETEKPFFLYLHATDPHSPYTPPKEYLDQIGQTVDDPSVGLIENVKELRRHQSDPQDLEDLVALYDAEIAFNDHHFGRLIEELKRRGLYDSSLIVLLSDHGEEFFDHGWWQHGKTLYAEQLAVPLIVRFPGGYARGTSVDSIAQQIDLFPTILRAAGVEVPEVLPGRSLLPRGDGARNVGAPIHAVSYLDLDDRRAESVTTAEGKLILHHYDLGKGQLLFDLMADRGETDNLWDRRPVLSGYLLSALRAFNLAHDRRLTPEQGEFDEELTERLKALGYLN